MLLVVGQSHTEAILAAHREDPSERVQVVNLNARDRKISVAEKLRRGGYLPDPGEFGLIASMVGGNFYNTFGLIENPIPFEFAEPGEVSFRPTQGRRLVTYELMFSYFNNVMRRGFLQSIVALKEHYGLRFVHVISPPPIGDDHHIAHNPGGYFSDKVHLGIAPASLRGKLYRLHTRVMVEFCQEQAISTLMPPPETVTQDGFLARSFWKNDPTHANTAYGHLVLKQLRAFQP